MTRIECSCTCPRLCATFHTTGRRHANNHCPISCRTIEDRRIQPSGRRVPRLGEAGRIVRLLAGARPLSFVCLARVSLGASHDHPSQAKGVGRDDRHDGSRPGTGRAGLGVSQRRRILGRPGKRFRISKRSLYGDGSELPRSSNRAGALGQGEQPHCDELRRRSAADVEQRV